MGTFETGGDGFMNIKIKVNRLLLFTPLLFLLSFWYWYTFESPDAQFIFSNPVDVFETWWALVISGELFTHTSVTLFETIMGFTIGTGLGATIGLMLWYSPLASYIAKPYIIAISAIPVFALAPMMIVWFGIGYMSKIMMAALSTFAVAMSQAYKGAQECDEKHLRLMQVMNASRWQIFRFVVTPSAMIWVINSMKLNIGLALLGAFIGEFVASEQGLGFIIVKASGLYDMATVFAACFTLTIIALILTKLVDLLEKRLLKFSSLAD